jgi:hypothetical protein
MRIQLSEAIDRLMRETAPRWHAFAASVARAGKPMGPAVPIQTGALRGTMTGPCSCRVCRARRKAKRKAAEVREGLT